MPRRVKLAPSALFRHYRGISRLLAGQLDFHSAIRAAAGEIAAILPHDHLDVCILTVDGQYHTAYESGPSTLWGREGPQPVGNSPIRDLLRGEAAYLLTEDAQSDPRFHFEGALDTPIFEQCLRSRIHVPMMVRGAVIGALSCSAHRPGAYGLRDVAHARSVADLLSPYFFALRSAEQARLSAIVEAEARAREEGLRQGALTLTEALERERQRIGMDLHDQTLAHLTRLARQMERLGEMPVLEGAALEPATRSLHAAMQELRDIIEQVTPSVLQLFGFAEAAENHLDRAIRESGAAMAARLIDDSGGWIDQLDHTVRIAVFRIVQEAINNAVRHSQGGRIDLRLSQARGRIVVEVTDDGRGRPAMAGRIGGGIENMATRARLISADLSVGAGPGGRGTRVRLSVPVAAVAERAAE
jgi:signal transduction histidine kinase